MPILVNSSQLWLEYRINPTTADKQYLDKPVLVEGKVTWVSSQYTVYLEGGKGAVDGVTTVPADNQSQAVSILKVGQTARFLCTGAGLVFNEPILLRCEAKP